MHAVSIIELLSCDVLCFSFFYFFYLNIFRDHTQDGPPHKVLSTHLVGRFVHFMDDWILNGEAHASEPQWYEADAGELLIKKKGTRYHDKSRKRNDFKPWNKKWKATLKENGFIVCVDCFSDCWVRMSRCKMVYRRGIHKVGN